MECPKCQGGAYLSDEELVKVIETSEPNRILIKAVHTCRACQERFSRLVWDELGPHRRHGASQVPAFAAEPTAPQKPSRRADDEEPEGLRFF